MSWIQGLLAVASGTAVGFSLGLIGGGGSILAVPLLVYVVGVSEPHVAIGTSALAVAASAFANLLGHWRSGTVKWRCAWVFAVSGVIGAAIGSTLGKLVEGQRLLFLFALLMIVVGLSMLRPRKGGGDKEVRLDARNAPRLVAIGLLVGGVSGFFGIGGGFLIVPGIMRERPIAARIPAMPPATPPKRNKPAVGQSMPATRPRPSHSIKAEVPISSPSMAAERGVKCSTK
jgi:uncharacterized membrane protein YfcA